MGENVELNLSHISDDDDLVSTFIPREDLIGLLTSLDFTRTAAVKALYNTGNYNADLAASWLLEHSQDPHLNDPLDISQLTIPKETHEFLQTFAQGVNIEDSYESDDSGEFMSPDRMYKMVFVVNSQLGMGVGKISAQVGHAAVALHRILLKGHQEHLYMWEKFGETKIVLKGNDASHLEQLSEMATNVHIPNYLVHDAGHTQVQAGSKTVLGLFSNVEKVNSITGTLPLL